MNKAIVSCHKTRAADVVTACSQCTENCGSFLPCFRVIVSGPDVVHDIPPFVSYEEEERSMKREFTAIPLFDFTI